MFQAERVGNVYMLWNSEVTDGGLQLSSASKAGSSIVPRREIGTRRATRYPDRYSYGGANSYWSCVDQGDYCEIKFRLGLNLFDLIKL